MKVYQPQFHHCFYEIETDRLRLANRDLQRQIQEYRAGTAALRYEYARYAERFETIRARKRAQQERRLKRRRLEQTRSPVNPVDRLELQVHLTAVFARLTSLPDIIALGELKNPLYMTNEKFRRLHNTVEAVTALNQMIGLSTIKSRIFDLICYYSQCTATDELSHIVLEGPPGVGKTRLGELLAKVMLRLGVLNQDKFIVARRSDLIAGYMGQTAIKTQEVIDKAQGGVLFIDEAYSLGDGNSDRRDAFAKECVDVINQNLTEKKGRFLCIIAGYADELDRCFFSHNPGLESRFPENARLKLTGYSGEELCDMFFQLVHKSGSRFATESSSTRAPLSPVLVTPPRWGCVERSAEEDAQRLLTDIFVREKKHFRFFGRDVDTLFTQAKFIAAGRIMRTNIDFGVKPSLCFDDVERAFQVTIAQREQGKTPELGFMYT